jgi:RHS repeat-associated protein
MKLLFSFLLFISINLLGQQNPVYDIDWNELTNINVTDSSINYVNGNGRATSNNLLKGNNDGWMEFTVNADFVSMECGFLNLEDLKPESKPELYSMSYSIVLDYEGLVTLYQDGSYLGSFGEYQNGDVFKIERLRDRVSFFKNEIVLTVLEAENISDKNLLVQTVFISENASIKNCKASFALLSGSVYKEHAAYDSPYSAITAVIPTGGDKDYRVSWNELPGIQTLQTELLPGIYHAFIHYEDDTLTVPVYLGLKNTWRLQKDISINDDTYTNTREAADSAATLISYNTIPPATNGWVELTIADFNQNSAFGFLGFASSEIDANYSVPYPNDNALTAKLNYADYLLYNRFPVRLNPNESSIYDYIHLVSFTNGIVNIGFKHDELSEIIHYKKGDIFRMHREGDLIKLYKNNTLIASENFSSYDQQLLNSVFVLSGTSALRSIGGLASVQGYDYAKVPYSLCTEPNLNWVFSRSFDENGIVKSESKEYMDMLGRTIQSQTKLFSENNVLVTEPLYDGYGRAVGQTLPAPSFSPKICYVTNFVEVSTSVPYTHQYFDNPVGVAAPGSSAVGSYNAPGDINHPFAVNDQTQGKLGWYYSDNNNIEPFVASDNYPYVRAEFYNDPTGRVKRSSGVGQHHYMGSNHENKFIYTSTPSNTADPLSNELNYVFPFRTYELEKDFTIKPNESGNLTHNLQLFKTIAINPDGKDQITYSNSSGQTIATCITGDGSDCVEHEDVKLLFKPGYDKTIETIYVPRNKSTTLKFYEKTSTGAEIYTNINPHLINAQTGNAYTLNTDYTYDNSTGLITFLGTIGHTSLHLQLGYTFVNSSYTASHPIYASVKVDYSQWTLYFYDRKGRLLGNAAPNDVVCLPLPYSAQRSSNTGNPPGKTNANNEIVRINLNAEAQNATNKFGSLKLKPIANTIATMTVATPVYTFQTEQQKWIEDSLYFVANPPIAYNDSSIVTLIDTTGVNEGYLDSATVDYYEDIDSMNRFIPAYALRGQKLHYSGKYRLYAKVNGTEVPLDVPAIPFDYYIEMNDTLPGGDSVSCRIGPPDDQLPTIIPDIPIDDIPDGTEVITVYAEESIITLGIHSPFVTNYNPGIYLSSIDRFVLEALNNAVTTIATIDVFSGPGTPIPIKLANKYYWDEFDRLMASESEDEGRVDYVYDQKEDKLLFTQNDKQRAHGGKFNCIVYDKLGRATITGEYNPLSFPRSGIEYYFQNYNDFYLNPVSVPAGRVSVGTAALVNNTTAYNDGHIFEKTFIEYDNPDTQLPVNMANTNFNQKFTAAKVSKTYNDNTTTWYSYDELGRQKWSVSNSVALGYKTINYAYDFRGKLLQSIYQEGSGDNFYHTFSYDADERLKSAKYGRYIIGDGLYLNDLASYSYYLHGPLKRTTLGGNLQGLDYVYTIGGMLKSINNPMSTATDLEPGMDGYATGPHANVSPDAFGLLLHYYPGDFVRTNSVIKSYNANSAYGASSPNSYSGLIKNASWRTKLPTGAPASYNNALMYEYKYNELYQLTDAQFGLVSQGSGYSQANFALLPEYKLENLSYDKNGNMQSLKRYAAPNGSGAAHLLDDLTYNYSTTLKNRLLKVGDGSTNTGGYTAEIDLPNQIDNNNYVYNEIGELVQNKQEDQGFEYNASGLTTRVYKLSTGTNIATFTYNDKGLRHSKIRYSTGIVVIPVEATYYSYDAGGMLLAKYSKDLIGGGGPVLIKDFTMYAAGRIGTYDCTSSKALFELSDHLGNTRAVIANDGNGHAQTVSYTDFYPHGGVLPGRNYVSSLGIPYAYQGQEKDAETNLLNFELRQYDARLGRWYNPDPMGQHHSPYLAMGNNPISMIDPDGGWDIFPGFDAIMGFINTWGFGTNLGEVNVYGEDLSGGGPKALQAVCATCGEEQMEINAKFNNLGAEYANSLKGLAGGNWWEQAIGHDKTFDNSVRNIAKQQGDIPYFLTGFSSGVRDAVVAPFDLAVAAWKDPGKVATDMAKLAYNTSPFGMHSDEGQAIMVGIANKVKNADAYDWGNFSGQVGVGIFGGEAAEAVNGLKIGAKFNQGALKLTAKATSKTLNKGKNSVYIKSAGQEAVRYDLLGKSHAGVPTPHKQLYKFNQNPITGAANFSRASKIAYAMGWKDMSKVVWHLLTN